jgi:aspartate aminotransferase
VIPTPSWVSYAPQAHILGRHIRWLETKFEDHWQLQPEQLEALCLEDPDRPRLVILNYPANPSGMTYKTDQLKRLADIARRYRVVLLSDEIYGETHHLGQHVSVARFYPEGTIISNGLSKWCGAGGWRLGVFAFPESLAWLREAMAVVASETYTSVSTPIQYAAIRAFRSDLEIERYLWQCRRILRRLGRVLSERMTEQGVRVHKPKGGFYLFPDFEDFREPLAARGITTSEQLCHSALEETGVAVLPGSDFGRPEHELTLRLAYVDFDGARALAAAELEPVNKSLPEDFVQHYLNNCVLGVDHLCRWAKGE